VTVVAGDARLSLEHEASGCQSQDFDLLVVDAFNSDSVPVHLLTKEAMALYLHRLRPDGLLLVQISNFSLDLTPVVMGLADHFHLYGARFTSPRPGYVADPATEQFPLPGIGHFVTGAQWIVLSRGQSFFEQPEVIERMDRDVSFAPVPLWTDDYSNLFRVLRKQTKPEASPEPEALNPGTQIR
jgi:hypothetical protein